MNIAGTTVYRTLQKFVQTTTTTLYRPWSPTTALMEPHPTAHLHRPMVTKPSNTVKLDHH